MSVAMHTSDWGDRPNTHRALDCENINALGESGEESLQSRQSTPVLSPTCMQMRSVSTPLPRLRAAPLLTSRSTSAGDVLAARDRYNL